MTHGGSICVVITAFNEENQIVSCIRNAKKLTRDVIVVDTESTDQTVALARKEDVPVYSFLNTRYVEPSRNFAIEKARAEWVFILDADEHFTDKLIDEIRAILVQTDKTHFKVQRRNIFAGKWHMKHGGWQNEAIIRMIKKDAFVDWPEQIHSTPHVNGDCGMLQEPLDHHFHPNLENMVAKTIVYENIESSLLLKAGRSADVPIFFRKCLGELYRRLIRNQGFRDGTPGIIESLYQAFSKTITYLFVYEKKRTSV